MSETKGIRLNKAAKEFNVGISTIIDFLSSKGVKIENNPNAKLDENAYAILSKEYASDKAVKEKAEKIGQERAVRETVTIDLVNTKEKEPVREEFEKTINIKSAVLPMEKFKEAPKPKVEPEPIPEIAAPVVEKVIAPKQEEIQEKVVESEPIQAESTTPETIKAKVDKAGSLKVVGKIDLDSGKSKKSAKSVKVEQKIVEPTSEEPSVQVSQEIEAPQVELPAPAIEPTPIADPDAPKEIETIRAKADKLEGFKVMGKIDLPVSTPKSAESRAGEQDKKKRKRIKSNQVDIKKEGNITNFNRPGDDRFGGGQKTGDTGNRSSGGYRPPGGGSFGKPGGASPGKPNPRFMPPKVDKAELSEEEIQRQIKETLARIGERGKSKAVKFRREKREEVRAKMEEDQLRAEEDKKVLKVTEFVSANELSQMMDVPVNNIIAACMSLGLFVSINQRLDAETITIIAEEFGFKVEFVTADILETIKEEPDSPEQLKDRAPIITVMGHVDHGKTSLLDYIRKTNVIAGEAGGITQHIGAYSVELENGKKITFIDTPGHEAFTAMRARGAKVTDVAIIVIAADDSVMPQTIEAINHAQAAGVPMIFAFNKIDKPGANPDKIREALAAMNYLVEDWGGKYQCQEISAKSGLGVDLLLEKVLLEAELLELKANPDKNASGTVIEAQLDKGRGFVCTVLVQNGTLKVGDVMLAGSYSGKVKAMFNERGGKLADAGPATPVRVLGLNGAPQAGDNFNVLSDEREAREIATKRLQLQREQGLRTRKHITLDEIGRRIAIGDFQQLNIIVKGDTDGSVEALSDSLLKLSTESIIVNIIHKSVGQISESDVLLASASDAIVVGFQVRPSLNAKKLAEKEEIDIRHYSIIYKAIEEIKTAMEGMLSPDIEEKITANVEVREVFNISKVGTVAGCYVLDGKINRNHKIRIIRDGIVVHTGELDSLKRFKDDVKEVATSYECGLSIKNFNDIKIGDIIEAYEEVEVARKL